MKKFVTIVLLLFCLTLPLGCSASSTSAEKYYDSGSKKFEYGNYQGSIEDYTKAIQLEPNNSDAYLGRGKIERLLKDYNNSIKDYTKAIEINPNNYRGYTGRGISKFELKDYAGSIEDCTKAIEINPDFEWAYLYRGKSKTKLKDYNGAAEDNKKYKEITKYFDVYMEKINKIIKSNWNPTVKKIGTSTVVRYTLDPKGEISDIKIIKSSGIIQNDDSAINAIVKSSPLPPLPPLPKEFQGQNVYIEFHFDIEPVL